MLVNTNFLTDKEVLPEKKLLEKAAAIKRFKYWPLVSKLKNQTSIAKNQYKLLKNQKISLITIEKIVIMEKKMWVMKVILLKSLMQF